MLVCNYDLVGFKVYFSKWRKFNILGRLEDNVLEGVQFVVYIGFGKL